MNTHCKLLLAVPVLVGMLSSSTSVHAVPEAMNYQGYLTDDTGAPLAAGGPENRGLEFRIYTQAAGGDPVWGEAQTATLFQGNFSVILGNGVALPGGPLSGGEGLRQLLAEASDPEFYISVALDGNELSPRQRLTTAPFAFRAHTAGYAENAGTVEGLDLVDETNGVIRPGVIDSFAVPVLPPTKIAATNGITASQLADNSVASGEIVDGSIRIEDLITELANSLVPIGAVLPFAGTADTVPAGFLLCNGSEISRNAYPELFAVIGTAHGARTATTFNVPDYRGRFLRGTDLGAGRDPNRNQRTAMAAGGIAGDNVGSVQADATAQPDNAFRTSSAGNHRHSITTGAGDAGTRDRAADGDRNGRDSTAYTNFAGNHTHSITGGDSETRPVNANVNYIIRTGR